MQSGELYNRLYAAFNHRLRRVAGGRFASRCRPTSVQFLITERCNARCCHCDIWQNRGKEATPSLEQWQAALGDLRAWLGPVHVTLTGGEALLVPFTPELVRHGSSLGLLIEVLSHGYWGDQSRVEALALARPWRVTMSLDGLGERHSKIRGREGFFERTMTSFQTLTRLRKEQRLGFSIRFKTVVMRHNLDQLEPLARFATQDGVDIFYQPIEQNYNTPEDPHWFLHSDNWPEDPLVAVAAVEELIRLKRAGLHIANSYAQLEAMLPYFRNPAALRLSTQGHAAHERRLPCAALELIQVQSNGDVGVCNSRPPLGNIKTAALSEIWKTRPAWWEGGCCLEQRLTPEERYRISPKADALPYSPPPAAASSPVIARRA
jgi:MoaA/NifB/PqqE/SkfB family radical SAM enzyme